MNAAVRQQKKKNNKPILNIKVSVYITLTPMKSAF
jgi:hypothetical protein